MAKEQYLNNSDGIKAALAYIKDQLWTKRKVSDLPHLTKTLEEMDGKLLDYFAGGNTNPLPYSGLVAETLTHYHRLQEAENAQKPEPKEERAALQHSVQRMGFEEESHAQRGRAGRMTEPLRKGPAQHGEIDPKKAAGAALALALLALGGYGLYSLANRPKPKPVVTPSEITYSQPGMNQKIIFASNRSGEIKIEPGETRQEVHFLSPDDIAGVKATIQAPEYKQGETAKQHVTLGFHPSIFQQYDVVASTVPSKLRERPGSAFIDSKASDTILVFVSKDGSRAGGIIKLEGQGTDAPGVFPCVDGVTKCDTEGVRYIALVDSNGKALFTSSLQDMNVASAMGSVITAAEQRAAREIGAPLDPKNPRSVDIFTGTRAQSVDESRGRTRH